MRTQTINIPAVQVEVANGVAYVAAGNGIESYSLLTGELLQVLPLGAAGVNALARDGTTLYALDASHTLRAIDLSGLSMSVLGSLSLPAGSGKLFVGNGIAYVGAGDGNTGGFVTADVANPAAMTLLSGVDANNIQGQAIVANGSGLAVSVGNTFLFGIGDTPSVDVLDVRDPTNSGKFLTRFNLPARPFDIAIGAGIAFVADGTGGLQVVNYLPFDNRGEAPTITLGAPTADRDPTTPGIQALEGSLINLKLDVADDQQVRNVELLVDGKVVANDVSFPWTAAVALPTLSAATSATVQARATDTGGNTTLSDAIVIELVPDTFAPTIVSSNVKDGSRHAQTFRTVRLSFDEPLDATDITTEHFRLLDASGTASVPTDVALSANGQVVTLTLPTLVQGSYRLVIDGDQVSDRAGNAFGSAGQIISTFDIVEATIEWTAPGGGDWNNAANWDLGRLPDATDVVLINSSSGATVNINGEHVRVQGIDAFSDLTLNGGSLTVDSFLTVHDGHHLTLNNGVIQHGTVNLEGDARLLVAGGTRSSRLDAVTVEGNIDLGENSTLRLKDVAIDGRVSLPDTSYVYGYASLAFEGTQTLGGHAEIVSAESGGYYYNTLEMLGDGELTLGADVRVHGRGLNIGNALTSGAVTLQRLVNRGTIEADTGTINVLANAFRNEGVAKAAGGTLNLSSGTNSNEAGAQLQVTGGTLTTSGNWQLAGGAQISGGTLNLGGTFDTTGFGGFVATGGVVNFIGSVDNSGETLTLGAGPTEWVLSNGSIQGGTLQIEAGERLLVAGGTRSSRLDAVTVEGNIDLGENSTLRLKDVAIDGRVSLPDTSYVYGYASLAFEGTQTLGGHAEIVSAESGGYYYNTLEMLGDGELTLGADVRVHGRGLNIGNALTSGAVTLQRLVNRGTIEADTGTINVLANAFRNEGTVRAIGSGSVLSVSNFAPNAGRIEASTGGLVSISGDFTNLPSGEVALGIGDTSSASNGRLAISGSAAFDGTLSVSTTGGFTPLVGQSYTLLSFASRTGSFASVKDENPTDGVTFSPIHASLDITLNVVAG